MCGGRPQPRRRCVRWGASSPHGKGYSSLPHLSAHVCCVQMAGWIRIPLGMELGLGSGDIVLDGDPAPPMERDTAASPLFSPCPLWANNHLSQLLLSSCCLGKQKSVWIWLNGFQIVMSVNSLKAHNKCACRNRCAKWEWHYLIYLSQA